MNGKLQTLNIRRKAGLTKHLISNVNIKQGIPVYKMMGYNVVILKSAHNDFDYETGGELQMKVLTGLTWTGKAKYQTHNVIIEKSDDKFISTHQNQQIQNINFKGRMRDRGVTKVEYKYQK